MLKISLNGDWAMKNVREKDWIPAVVPGSVVQDLLAAGKIEDPFYRDNEDAALALSYDDYEYRRSFEVTEEMLSCDQVVLHCEGLDTLADIRVNGQFVAHTENMHRTYSFDIKPYVRIGQNTIHIVFASPSKYIEARQAETELWGPDASLPGFPHLRKAHYMFGWDWGPMIPDAGIWRKISVKGFSYGKLHEVYVRQKHQDDGVQLDVQLQIERFQPGKLAVEVQVVSPDGQLVASTVNFSSELFASVVFQIENPQLWWPNGYGEQPLYEVRVQLLAEGLIVDSKQLCVGLRTLRVRREKDEWGESFEFEINGVSIFAKGANYIPEDNLLGRRARVKTEQLIKDSVEAHFNCIRVWGGGIYPEDEFFELCDQYGLIVWQDFMFACGVYGLTDDFAENVAQEAIDNIRRIRHHACLGLWCGNNEMETAWVNWDFPKTPKLRTDYIKLFEVLLPDIVHTHDPQTMYWPSSPSSGGGFDDPNAEDKGDVHYWEVWHGLKPFTDYRKFYFRFCSEFGFQSFPGYKTVETYTLPEDRNIFSYVMEKHQKNKAANGKILYYLSENFKYPKDFDSLLYASQLLQAEAIKYGVEHWRRNRGRCMGAIYWQLNDCWPVASWASIDSFGRWKALHYFAKKFYAPILLSAQDEGLKVDLALTNDTLDTVRGQVVWKLRDHGQAVLQEGASEVEVAKLQARNCLRLDFTGQLDSVQQRSTYVEFSFVREGETQEVQTGTVLFVKAKHFAFLPPHLEWSVQEKERQFEIEIRSDVYAKYIELALKNADGKFSDNYFDLSGGAAAKVSLWKESLSKLMTIDEIRRNLSVRSLFEIS